MCQNGQEITYLNLSQPFMEREAKMSYRNLFQLFMGKGVETWLCLKLFQVFMESEAMSSPILSLASTENVMLSCPKHFQDSTNETQINYLNPFPLFMASDLWHNPHQSQPATI